MQDKLLKLKTLLEVANQDTFSEKQFLEAFKKVLEYFKAMKEQNAKDVETMKAMIFSMLSEVQTKNQTQIDAKTNSAVNDLQNLKTSFEEVVTQAKKDSNNAFGQIRQRAVEMVQNALVKSSANQKLDEILAKAQDKISEVDNKIVNVRNGKDGIDGKDGSPDTDIEIRNKLETLTDEERLDRKAVKGIDELEKKLSDKIDAVPRGRGGGGGGIMRSATQYYTLTPDGSTKVFSVPKSVTSIVFMSDFPYFLIENNGFTINASRTQITLTTDNAPSTNSQLIYSYSSMFGIL